MRIADQTANRLRVIKAIRTRAPLSRSDLPTLTGLSRGTITQVVGNLVDRGLLIETKEPATRRAGRPRTFLQINPRGAVVIGVSLSSTGMLRAAFVDLAGNKVSGVDVRLAFPARLEDLATDLALALEKAIAESPFELKDLNRIGLAIPALVDSRRGVVRRVAVFPAGEVPFAEIISSRLGLPVTVEHEVISMARAEHWFGRAQELDTFSLLYIGSYVGSADYQDGLPRLGANGLGPELGHVKTAVGPEAPLCFCGQRGCVSAFASMYGMVQLWTGPNAVTAQSIAALPSTFGAFLDHADAGDPPVTAVVEQGALHLGVAVANHIAATDPGTVLVLADDSRLQQALDGKLQAAAERNLIDGFPPTSIVCGVADAGWRWKGAAALALEKLYLEDTEQGAAEAGFPEHEHG
jgi:predicted NBD/HSP70 family sugar kinase